MVIKMRRLARRLPQKLAGRRLRIPEEIALQQILDSTLGERDALAASRQDVLDFPIIELDEDLRYDIVWRPFTILLHKLISLRLVVGVDVIKINRQAEPLPRGLDWFHCNRNAMRTPIGIYDIDAFGLGH